MYVGVIMALLQEVLRGFLRDEIPSSSSRLATLSHKAAEELLEWISRESNTSHSEAFTSSIVELLDGALPQIQLTRMQAARERMWGAYHSIRTSQVFKCLWTAFLKELNIDVTPIFYQSLTDRLFQKRVEFHFRVQDSAVESVGEECTFTFEEENAIRYAAGYVFRAVKKKVMKSSNCHKEQLIEVVDMLLQDDDDVGEDDASCEWTATVDRGGLIHISDDLYRVFVAIEVDIRRFLRIENALEMTPSSNSKKYCFIEKKSHKRTYSGTRSLIIPHYHPILVFQQQM